MGRILDVIQSETLNKIRCEVEKFVTDSLKDYLKECKTYHSNVSLSCQHTKNFYDSVWGTIEINEGEILILDSPILQRLRHIKQLGLADLLYSSANHSRFSHTLGVLQTADVMAKQIDKELKKNNVTTDAATFQIVRLASIFHDVGHMFCSHASEQYFQKNRKSSLYEKVKNIQNYFKDSLHIEPSLSEIISVLIVNSKDIRNLLEEVQGGLDLSFNTIEQDVVIEKICCLILGFPYSKKMIPYAKVISGQVDSDKLDYLKRDSHSTGVPIAVDMSRIFQKLRVVASHKKFDMVSNDDEPIDSIYKIAIAPAAINTIDQLVISRYMMFENIYYHQKTLTAEETLRYALLKLDESTEGLLDDFSKILRLNDYIVIHNDFQNSLKSVIKGVKIKDPAKFKDACNILENIYRRRLFKRCCAFTMSNLTPVIQNKRDFFSKVIAEKSIAEQNYFIQKIIEQTIKLKKEFKKSNYRFNEKTDILLLIAPDISSATLSSNIAIADKTNKDRDEIFEADNWLKSRASRKPQNYLVSYTEDRYLVYIATEIVLLSEYGCTINDSIIFTDSDEIHINDLKHSLDKSGYFKELYALAPNTEIATHECDMQALIENWKAYELFDIATGNGIKLDMTYLTFHINQFRQFKEDIGDFNIFLNGYLELLKHVEIISKEKIAKALIENLKYILKIEGCSASAIEVCNIGSSQDGSSQIAYHMNIVNQALQKKWQVKDLLTVLENGYEEKIVVFLEDAFCSGKQILSVFETYMGIPKEDRQTQEEHVKMLSSEQKEKLKHYKLYFSFVFYEKEKEDFFYQRMKEIGLSNVKIVAPRAFPLGYFKEIKGENSLERTLVRRYLEAAGKKLIKYKSSKNGLLKPSWDEYRIQTSTLGYNDAQQLVAFVWNTPTYTITPLWLGANTEEFKWVPLFPRIDK